MTQNVKQSLAALAGMTPAQLRVRYRELFGEETRAGHRQWLYRRCAWRLQSLAEGDLFARARRLATELATDSGNVWIPRDAWLDDAEKQAIVQFHREHPLEGYRRLTYMMIDANIVAVTRRSRRERRYRPRLSPRSGFRSSCDG